MDVGRVGAEQARRVPSRQLAVLAGHADADMNADTHADFAGQLPVVL